MTRLHSMFLWCVMILLCLNASVAMAQDGLEPPPEDPLPEPEKKPAKPPTIKPLQKIPLTKKEKKLLDPHVDKTPLNRAIGWRFGPTLNGFFGSQQGRPLVYPNLGWRYKTNGLYIDINAPGLFGALDFGQYSLQQSFNPDPFNLFLSLNEPGQFVYIEAMHLRAGPLFNLRLFKDKTNPGIPLTVAVGVVGIADWVIFDAVFLGRKFEDIDDLNDYISIDPIVVGVGGFVSLLWEVNHVTVDLAFEVGRDLVDLASIYIPQSGWIIGLDMDVHINILQNMGMYIRPRLSMFTHLPEDNVYTMVMSAGVIFSL